MQIPQTREEQLALYHLAEEAYRKGEEIMSDEQFDNLERLLGIDPESINDLGVDDSRDIDPEEYRQVIASRQFISNELATKWMQEFGTEKPHTLPMGSLDKALNLGEMQTYYNRIKEATQDQVYSTKMDGLSAELTYEGGLLQQILTRGDGSIGTDITAIAFQSKQVPLQIPNLGKVVVRGEIMLFKQDLINLNIQQEESNRKVYKTTRNGAVGVVKSLKNFSLGKYLTFFAFDLVME